MWNSDKPDSCAGCSLSQRGRAFLEPSGPDHAQVIILGESAGAREVIEGRQFVGDAGMVLNRALYLLDKHRDEFRFQNILSCQPPGNKIDNQYYEHTALAQCKPNWRRVIDEPGHSVIVTAGALPTRQVLGLAKKGFELKNFHGYTIPIDTASGTKYVIPTFHPSHINRGAWNLFGTLLFDLRRAFTVADSCARGDYDSILDEPELVIDPDVEWFTNWISRIDKQTWLAVDIETPDKSTKSDEGELGAKDRSFTILRVNLSYNRDEGITVPYVEPYISLIHTALVSGAVLCFWNKDYDVRRLLKAGAKLAGPCLDFMWAWHILQSDLPRGLGFVTPFYSLTKPWKHLGNANTTYCAYDGVQTLRNAFGISAELKAAGQWDVFWKHVYLTDKLMFDPSCEIGLLVDEPRLNIFKADILSKKAAANEKIQSLIPEALKPIKGGSADEGWVKDPGATKVIEDRTFSIFPRTVIALVNYCHACNYVVPTKKHRCADPLLKANVQPTECEITRYFYQADFNPNSSKQMLAYIEHIGATPGKNKQTGNPAADADTLKALAKKQKDPKQKEFFKQSLLFKGASKVISTYINATIKRLEQDKIEGDYTGRLRPTVTYAPSTMRTSYKRPNLQNVVARGELAAGFRDCLIAEPGCVLITADFAGIEAVMVGYFSGDPVYIRLAWLGVHAYLTSHLLGKPVDLAQSDEDLLAAFHEIKDNHLDLYDMAKRTIHGSNYGLTPYGMHDRFPEVFKNLKDAQRVAAIYAQVAPALPKWQNEVRELAHKQRFLGGSAHPFHYKHWFWDVLKFRPVHDSVIVAREKAGRPYAHMNGKAFAIEYGEDAKRTVAYYPQSTAAGEIKETGLELFDPASSNYIGDLYHGRTPLRAIVHDEFLLEVETRYADRAIERLHRVMTAPIKQMPMPVAWGLGDHLKIGVNIAIGPCWNKKKMEEVKIDKDSSRLAKDLQDTVNLDVEYDEYEEEDSQVEEA